MQCENKPHNPHLRGPAMLAASVLPCLSTAYWIVDQYRCANGTRAPAGPKVAPIRLFVLFGWFLVFLCFVALLRQLQPSAQRQPHARGRDLVIDPASFLFVFCHQGIVLALLVHFCTHSFWLLPPSKLGCQSPSEPNKDITKARPERSCPLSPTMPPVRLDLRQTI